MTAKDYQRFAAKVAPPDMESGCQVWLGCKNRDGGYGLLSVEGKMELAHRLAYEHFVGPIPVGLLVLHRCDNPGCVCPEHLSIGSAQENATDRNAKGRAARGCGHGMAKLTDEKVRIIKARYLEGQTQRTIAAQMGVAQTQISAIVRGETWSHVI